MNSIQEIKIVYLRTGRAVASMGRPGESGDRGQEGEGRVSKRRDEGEGCLL